MDQYIEEFLNYNFTPFRKGQCLKRLVLLWLFSAVLCLIGKRSLLWCIALGIANLPISIIFLTLVVKQHHTKVARFLCDGLFYLYMAIILTLAAYRILVLQGEANALIAAILLLLLAVFLLIFTCITWHNIMHGKFSAAPITKTSAITPFLGAACGVLAGRLFLSGQSQQTALLLVAFILLTLAFLLSIPALNLMKAYYYKMIHHTEV